MRFASAVVRRPWAWLVAAALTVLALLAPASGLTLETAIVDLLPDGDPAAADYRAFLDGFGGLEKVFVVVSADEPEPEALADAASALADRLRASPEVRDVRSGLSEEDERFFLEEVAPRAPLFAEPDRVTVALRPDSVERSVEDLRLELAGPAGAAMAPLLAADPLGLAGERLRHDAGAGGVSIDPATGALLSSDGTAALLVVTPSRAETDAEGGRRLRDELRRAFDEAGPGFTFHAVGGPLYAAHDEEALREDLTRVSGGAVLGVGGLIVLACGGLAIPLAAMAAVGAGLVATGAFVAVGMGPVTAIGVGFGAILIGLGDDYVNHLGAAHRDGVLRGRSPLRSLAASLRHSGPGVAASAATTAGAFATLAFAHFRPLRELGWAVAAGMAAMLAATFLVGVPVLAVLLRRPPASGSLLSRLSGAGWNALGRTVHACVGLARRRPLGVLVGCVLLAAAAAPGLARLTLDSDPRRLRPDDHPSVDAERILAEKFGVGMETTTLVVRAPDLEGALDRADAVARIARNAVGPSGDVRSPADWLVSGARLAERRRVLARASRGAAARLSAALDAHGFDPRAFAAALDALRSLEREEGPALPPRERWPDWIAESVRDGSEGAAVAVHVRHADTLDAWSAGPPADFLRDVESAAPGTAVASVPRLGKALRATATGDLRRLGAIALLLVGVVVVASFRGDLRASLLAFVPVALGTVWTYGAWGLAGKSLDLFSLAVTPILLGLGVDHGLHVLHRVRTVPREGIGGAVIGSGRAMALSTLTTCVGFGSLLLSRVPGLRDGGLLVASGLFAALAATLVALPAIEAARGGGDAAAPPHAPEGGAARRLLGRFHVTGVFWYRFHLFGARVTGPFVGAVILLFSTFFWVALRRIRSAVASNLGNALGPCGPIERERRIFRTFHNFAWCLTERYENLDGRREFDWEIDGEERWRSVDDAPGGFILLTAHVGNWEVGSMEPAERSTRRVHVVREEETDPRAQEFVRGLLARRGERYLTHFATDDPSLGMRLLAALRAGDVVALQGDRPRARGRTIPATLFGRPFSVPAGVPALARAAGVPVVPVFVLRRGRRRYRLVVREPIRFPVSESRAEAEVRFAGRVTDELERAIRAEPHQWFCFRELWPTPAPPLP